MSEPRDQGDPDTGSGARKVTSDLEARIARARGQRQAAAEAGQTRQGDMSGMGRGFRLASEFVAAILVGAGLGWLIDSFLPTRPWATVVFLLLGFAAGVLNVVRATKEINDATPVPPPAPRDDEDD
jgi:ATP synthase protein I